MEREATPAHGQTPVHGQKGDTSLGTDEKY